MSELNIPDNWTSATFDDLISFRTGHAFKSSEFKNEGVFVLRVTNINDQSGNIEKDDCRFISNMDFEKKYKNVSLEENDVLIVMVGASTGKIGIVTKDILPAALNQNMWNLKPIQNSVEKKFLFHYLNSIRKDVLEGAGGSARGFIKQSDFKVRAFPTPPQAEQQRIVQKIESCFEKIDATEANLNKVEILLGKYRESLLAKAFRGELVPQDPTDEPASVLIENILKERSQIAKSRKVQEPEPISEEEKTFELPVGWGWVRLGDILSVETGATPLKSNRAYYQNGNIPWLTSSVTSKPFVSEAEQFITKKALEETNCKLFPSGTLLIAMYGEGKTRGQVTETTFEATTNQAVAAIIFNGRTKDLKDFVKLYFMAKYEKIRSEAAGGTQLNLNTGNIKSQIIPVPPLAEQLRIIKKISTDLERITGIIFSVEIKLKKMRQLKESILKKAFEGRLVEQIPSEGTGHDLLAKILAEKEISQESKSELKTNKTVKKKVPAKAVKVKGKKHGKK